MQDKEQSLSATGSPNGICSKKKRHSGARHTKLDKFPASKGWFMGHNISRG
jgi:hypothetical protein